MRKKQILILIFVAILLSLSACMMKEDFNIPKEQWALKNTAQIINTQETAQKGVAGVDINVSKAWDITKGNKSVCIAIIDSGVNYKLPSLNKKIYIKSKEKDSDKKGLFEDINSWDFYNNDSSVYDSDLQDYHGTCLAMTIVGDHKGQVLGIAPEATILPVKFMRGTTGDVDDAIKAIDYACTQGAQIINCSWNFTDYNEELYKTIKKHSDILFVCAASNLKVDVAKQPVYPACYDLNNIISVMAIDNKGTIYDCSGYGKTIDLAAPGVNVITSFLEGETTYTSGTSIATANVTGVAALIKSKYPELSSKQIIRILKKSVHELESLKGICNTGGLVDAYAGLLLAAKSR